MSELNLKDGSMNNCPKTDKSVYEREIGEAPEHNHASGLPASGSNDDNRTNQDENDCAQINRRSPLWQHFQRTGPRAIKCKHCGKALTQTQDASVVVLWRHINGDHPHLLEKDNGITWKTGRRKSLVWDHFTQIGPARATCNYCGKALHRSKLMIHLKREHPSLDTNCEIDQAQMGNYKRNILLWSHFQPFGHNEAICNYCKKQLITTNGSLKELWWHLKVNHSTIFESCDKNAYTTIIKTAEVWNHASKIGPDTAMCNYCKKVVCQSHILNHIKRLHSQMLEKCGTTDKSTVSKLIEPNESPGRVSILWNYFKPMEDQRAKCGHCCAIINLLSDGLLNMKNHIETRHRYLMEPEYGISNELWMEDNKITDNVVNGQFTIDGNTKSSSRIAKLLTSTGEVFKGFVICRVCTKILRNTPAIINSHVRSCVRTSPPPESNGLKRNGDVCEQDLKREMLKTCAAWIMQDDHPYGIADSPAFRIVCKNLLAIGAKNGEHINVKELLPDASAIARYILYSRTGFDMK